MNRFQTTMENTLVNCLNNGYVVFSYIKVDGSQRMAVGTRNLSLIKRVSDWRPKGGKEASNVVCYFDLVENAWRSFRRGNLDDIAVSDFCVHDVCSEERYLISEDFAMRTAIRYAMSEGLVDRVVELTNHLLFGLDSKASITITHTHPDSLVKVSVKEKVTTKSKNDIVDEINYHAKEIERLTKLL